MNCARIMTLERLRVIRCIVASVVAADAAKAKKLDRVFATAIPVYLRIRFQDPS